MGVLFIAVILVSGFIYTNSYPPARFRQKRASGWDAYFHVAQWGTVISVISSILFYLADYSNFLSYLLSIAGLKVSDLVLGMVWNQIDIRIATWILLTLLLAFGCGKLMALRYADPEKGFQIVAEIASKDHMESIILESSSTQLPVLITLSNRKWFTQWKSP